MFDAAVVLRGPERYAPRPDELALAWILSDSDSLSARELSGYDAVAFASQALADRFAAMEIPTVVARPFSPQKADWPSAEPLDGPAAELLASISEDDVVFVGDSLEKRRDFILEIAQAMPIKVIGQGWDQYLPMDMVVGTHIDDATLTPLYGKAFAVLHEHSPDMSRAGVLPRRILDIVTAGGLAISDWNEGAALVSPDMFFRSAADAVTALRRLRDAPARRHEAIDLARRNVGRRFDARVTADGIYGLLCQAHEDRMRGSRRGR
jgi:hypothetical protein